LLPEWQECQAEESHKESEGEVMTDLGARSLAEALKFLGICLINAAFVHKSPAHFQEIMEAMKVIEKVAR
jgi:hypothetical protein